jgi:coenzyme F420-reducing hydrogenase delta subunit
MDAMEFIQQKIDDCHLTLGEYRAKGKLEYWEQSIMEGVESELLNYRNVLKTLKEGKLEVA